MTNKELIFELERSRRIIRISVGILKTWHDYCEVKHKYCEISEKEHWFYCIEKIEELSNVLEGNL